MHTHTLCTYAMLFAVLSFTQQKLSLLSTIITIMIAQWAWNFIRASHSTFAYCTYSFIYLYISVYNSVLSEQHKYGNCAICVHAVFCRSIWRFPLLVLYSSSTYMTNEAIVFRSYALWWTNKIPFWRALW